MFSKKAKKNENTRPPEQVKQNTTKEESHHVNDIPRICIFDMSDDVIKELSKKGLNCTPASLGKLTEVPNIAEGDEHYLRLNSFFPLNLHEFHVIVMDIQNDERVPYDPSMLDRKDIRGDQLHALLSKYPETVFDPKPLAAHYISQIVDNLLKKDFIFIAFADGIVTVEYKFVRIEAYQTKVVNRETYSNYSFYSDAPQIKNKCGKVIQVAPEAGRLSDFLKRHLPNAIYRTVFKHPTHYDGYKRVKDDHFLPLLINGDSEIVSYVQSLGKSALFMFPQIKDKKSFLADLLTSEMPEIFPSIFPDAKYFAWIEDPRYILPNYAKLIEQKRGVESEYKGKMAAIDALINNNKQKYSYLHDLLTQTDTSLVKAVERFLNYLEFNEVINVDETHPELREEDLRANVVDGLLVMEVKGIGGTSTDSDCSQISKIRFRRIKERNKLDVYGLYIVNHQRHLPTDRRKNPPFTEQQIKDALSDNRGLLSTYQLFKLFNMIEEGMIEKKDARKAMLSCGLIDFIPSCIVCLGIPQEVLKEKYVAIVTLSGQAIKKGDLVFILKDDIYRRASVQSLMVNDVEVSETDKGEVGIRLDTQLPKNAELFLKLPN